MTLIRNAAAAALFCFALVAPLSAQAPDWSKVEIKAEKVAGTVWMLTGVGGFAGGNIAVSVGDDGLVLVDSQFEPLVPKIEAALARVSDKPVRFVINTHAHADHSHGNKAFGKKATIVAHDNTRKRMAADNQFEYAPGTTAPPHALPVITFDSRVTLHLNGEEIRGLHLPRGHTDGDTAVFFTGSKVVHMGDDFFNGMFPFVDLDSGGSLAGYLAALETALAEIPADARVIPGHGALATRADVAAYLATLEETADVVRQGIASGKSLDHLKAAKVLAKWEKLSWDFVPTDAYLEMAYKSLSAKN